MKVAVVGVGALGLLLTSKLIQAECSVVAVTRTEGQAAQLRAEGIRLDEGERGGQVACQAFSVSEWSGEAELLILTVKQTALPTLLNQLSHLLPQGVGLLPLMNGMGHLEKLRQALPHCHLLAGVTTEGALRLDSRSVRHTGSGKTLLGIPFAQEHTEQQRQGLSAMAHRTASLLTRSGWAAEVSDDICLPMWSKLLVNCIVNPLTALFEVPNGGLLQDGFQPLLHRLSAEGMAVARASGVAFDSDIDLVQMVRDVCQATADNHSSMLQDITSRRKTEREALSGYIVEQAKLLGIEVPVHQVLRELLRAKEQVLTS